MCGLINDLYMSTYKDAQRKVIRKNFMLSPHLLIYYYAYGEFKDFIDVWNNSNCASSLNATVLYWIINTDCGLLSFQTEEFLILT